MLASALHLALTGLAIVAALMFALWVIHLIIRNAAIVDVGWAAGWLCLRSFTRRRGRDIRAQMGDRGDGRLLGIAAGGLLVFFHAWPASRRKGATCSWRKEWKTHLRLRFLFFYEFQAALTVVLSLPFLLASVSPAVPLRRLEKIGAGIWLVSIFGEAVADFQLNRFRKRPENRGKTYRRGLWGYSRHPNYFFEWMIWVGYAIFALGSPWGWLGLISPALMLYFLTGRCWDRCYGSASAADAWYGISRLPENNQHVYSVVSEERSRQLCRGAANLAPNDYRISRTSS